MDTREDVRQIFPWFSSSVLQIKMCNICINGNIFYRTEWTDTAKQIYSENPALRVQAVDVLRL